MPLQKHIKETLAPERSGREYEIILLKVYIDQIPWSLYIQNMIALQKVLKYDSSQNTFRTCV